MAAHAKRFPPSGSKRWMSCTASVIALEQLPREQISEGSFYAYEGSAAHELSRRIAVNDWLGLGDGQVYLVEQDVIVSADDPLVGLTFGPVVQITQEMIDYAEGYVAYCRGLPGHAAYEQRVDFSQFVPEGFGTSDAIIYNPDTKRLDIVDLKYGQGVRVNALDNSQLLLYALGAVLLYEVVGEIKTVGVHIYMPRLDHIDVAEYPIAEIWAFAERASAAAAEALSVDAKFVPGTEQCRWCDAAPTCPALASKALSTAAEEFSSVEDTLTLVASGGDVPLKKIDTLEPEHIGHLLSLAPLLSSWIKTLEGYAFDLLHETHGQGLPGYKLVAGRSLRKWSDSEAAAKRLAELGLEDGQVFSRSLVSPSQAEKLLGKKHAAEIKDFVTKPPGKPTLVAATDSRPALALLDGSEFNDETAA